MSVLVCTCRLITQERDVSLNIKIVHTLSHVYNKEKYKI